MKEPIVIIHRGYFYVAYYLPGIKHAVKSPVGKKADVVRPCKQEIEANPHLLHNWWRSSRKKGEERKGSMWEADIETAVNEAKLARHQYIKGEPWNPPKQRQIYVVPVLDLLSRYNKDPDVLRTRGRPSKNTLEKRNSAIRSLLKFDPKATSRSLSSKSWVLDYRDWAEENYEGEALRSYVNNLKPIVKWALEQRLIEKDYFTDMKISLGAKKRVKHTRRENEYKVFRYMYSDPKDKNNRSRNFRLAFYQALMERLNGYRQADITQMEREDIDRRDGRILGTNTKMGREQDDFPISDATSLLLSLMEQDPIVRTSWEELDRKHPRARYLFYYRATDSVTEKLVEASEAVGVPRITSHQLKHDFSLEIQPATRHDRSLYNLLLHHLPTGMDKVGRLHYTGEDLEQMKMALDQVQGHWVEFLSSLTVTDGRS